MAGFGLRLARSQGMEGFTGNLNEFLIDPTQTNAIFTGDPVILNGGYVEEASGNSGAAPFTTAILGIFMGCRFVDTDGDYEFRNFWDGNTGRSDIVAHVAMPPHQMYHAKLNAPSTQAAAVGQRCAPIWAAGSPAYGDSRVTIDQATLGTGGLLIHRLAALPGNAWTNPEPIVEVSVALQQGTHADAA